jgi:hypothetical protein
MINPSPKGIDNSASQTAGDIHQKQNFNFRNSLFQMPKGVYIHSHRPVIGPPLSFPF